MTDRKNPRHRSAYFAAMADGGRASVLLVDAPAALGSPLRGRDQQGWHRECDHAIGIDEGQERALRLAAQALELRIVEKTTKRAGTVRRCLREGCDYSENVGEGFAVADEAPREAEGAGG